MTHLQLSPALKTLLDSSLGLRDYLLALEAEIITQALDEYKTITDAARALKINRSTLSMRIIMHEERGIKFPKYGTHVKRGLVDDRSYFRRAS